jgi:DNA-binding LacI/PurR family transcriptional regulator
LRARQAAGFVLIRSTVLTQRLVAAAGIPAVVSGTLQPSITNLPSVDRDQRQIGKLMAEFLFAKRCDRYLVLMRERLAAGDHAMLDGALEALTAEGVGLDRIVVRCLPTDDDAIAASVGEQIAATRGRLGTLCRSEPLARGVLAAAALAGCGPKRRPALIVADAVTASAEGPHFPSIESTITPEEWGATLGRVLAATADGRKPDPYRLIIPVRVRP